MKILPLLFLMFFVFDNLNGQTFSSTDPLYKEHVEEGESLLRSGDYDQCIVQYEKAFEIKWTSFLSTMRAAACGYKANDQQAYRFFLDKAFELSWSGSKNVFDNSEEFRFLDGSDFENQVNILYLEGAEEAGVNVKLMTELQNIQKSDQEQRRHMREYSEKYGWQSAPMDSLWKIQSYSDSVNSVRVIEIIKEYGYPGKSLVGEQTASAAFLVIQHADLDVQEENLPILSAAADKGEVRWSSIALLIDRVEMRNNRRQIYGSQVSRDSTGQSFFFEIQKPYTVDSLRATKGLGPLSEYAERFGFDWDPDAHIERHQSKV